MAKNPAGITKLDPKADGQSADLVAENVTALKALFPEIVTDGKIDFDTLRQVLGDTVDAGDERYGLNWSGKARARRIAQTPSSGTLRPCPEESVDWDTTQNIFIEGDNLEVLKLLQKSYHRRVKMIYIDPPYNTGKEFIYPDKFQDNLDTYLKYTGQKDSEGFKQSANVETGGRYHTNWLNMMYPRLRLARNLLREDGAIFVTIDDNEAPSLRHMMNELFGEENFVANVVWNHTKQSKNDEDNFSRHHNQVFVYRRSDQLGRFRFPRTDEDNRNYSNPDNDEKGAWRSGDVRSPSLRPTLRYDIQTPSGKSISPPDDGWRWSEDTLRAKIATGEIIFSADETKIIRKIYLAEQEGRTPENLWLAEFAGTTRQATGELKDLFGDPPFDTPKPLTLVRKFLQLASSEPNDIILDFFAGSGTTGHAAMEQSCFDQIRRRVILVQLPEAIDAQDKEQSPAINLCDGLEVPRTIAEVTKERLRRAGAALRAAHLASSSDLGFKVFKLDSSNIKSWDGDPADVDAKLLATIDNIKPDRTDDDLLYELLLKFGLDLAVPIERRTIAGKPVQVIGAGALVVCLADKLSLETVDGISGLKAELEPEVMRVVFRDACFETDVIKTNAVQILRRAGILDIKSL